MKFTKILLCCILIFSLFSLNAFALSSSTYADLAQSSSQVQNLVSYAKNFPGFIDSDFVVFQNGQYSYYIFWGDLVYDGNRVTADKADCISYIREGSGASYSYRYSYSDQEVLSLTVNHLVCSNIDGLGSSSALYEQYKSYYNQSVFNVFFLAILFSIMVLSFRRTFKT